MPQGNPKRNKSSSDRRRQTDRQTRGGYEFESRRSQTIFQRGCQKRGAQRRMRQCQRQRTTSKSPSNLTHYSSALHNFRVPMRIRHRWARAACQSASELPRSEIARTAFSFNLDQIPHARISASQGSPASIQSVLGLHLASLPFPSALTRRPPPSPSSLLAPVVVQFHSDPSIHRCDDRSTPTDWSPSQS